MHRGHVRWRAAWCAAAMAVAGLTIAAVLTTTAADAADEAEAVEIEIRTLPGLRFDITRFAVEPGAEVTITLINPDEMQHNLLITAPGARMAVANAAIELGPAGLAQAYVPDMEEVLVASELLNPHESQTFTFTAPREEGVYPYVCTVPGHAFVMYGAMYVTRDADALPDLAEDPHVPPAELAAAAAAEHDHAADGHAHDGADAPGPQVRRTFLPDASPAAIAVHAGRNLSFVWDAGTMHLRYAWRGGFVDSTAHWRGNGARFSEVVGHVYYRAGQTFPLRLGDVEHVGERQFRGYRMIDGLPQFEYELDGYRVRQHVTALPHGVGLEMRFEIEGIDGDVYYVTDPEAGAAFASTAGEWDDGVLHLSGEEARSFTITLAERPGHEPLGYWSMNDMPWFRFGYDATTEGVIGRAVRFNARGDDVDRIPTGIRGADGAEGMTFAGWFRVRDADAQSQVIFGQEGGEEPALVLGYNVADEAGLTLRYADEGRTARSTIGLSEPGRWHFAAFTIEGDTGRLYLNGEHRGELRLGELPEGARFVIGAFDEDTRFFGDLDELRVWGRVLDKEDLERIYRSELPAEVR